MRHGSRVVMFLFLHVSLSLKETLSWAFSMTNGMKPRKCLKS